MFHYQGLSSKDAEDNTVAGGRVIDRSERKTFYRKTKEEEEFRVNLHDKVEEHEWQTLGVRHESQIYGCVAIETQAYEDNDSEDVSKQDLEDYHEHSEAKLRKDDAEGGAEDCGDDGCDDNYGEDGDVDYHEAVGNCHEGDGDDGDDDYHEDGSDKTTPTTTKKNKNRHGRVIPNSATSNSEKGSL